MGVPTLTVLWVSWPRFREKFVSLTGPQWAGVGGGGTYSDSTVGILVQVQRSLFP